MYRDARASALLVESLIAERAGVSLGCGGRGDGAVSRHGNREKGRCRTGGEAGAEAAGVRLTGPRWGLDARNIGSAPDARDPARSYVYGRVRRPDDPGRREPIAVVHSRAHPCQRQHAGEASAVDF